MVPSSLQMITASNPLLSPLSTTTNNSCPTQFSSSSLRIRMGGGPRTYPGGVSKWQWKRMQAKKAKQLLKARLTRERQLYEMRKRTELKDAIAELERPWEVVERAPTLFSASADEQVKALADRFQKPGGFDMWTEKDGPQIFCTPDGLPSARFFPKNSVHSVKPYGVVTKNDEINGEDEKELTFDDWIAEESEALPMDQYKRSSNKVEGQRVFKDGKSQKLNALKKESFGSYINQKREGSVIASRQIRMQEVREQENWNNCSRGRYGGKHRQI